MEQKQSKFFLVTVLGIGLMGFLSLISVAFTAVGGGSETVWYTATLGTTPDQQQMDYAHSNGFQVNVSDAEQAFINGATQLDTTETMTDYAGYGIDPVNSPTLIAANGFKMTFISQVVADNHTRDERSGFSVILLDNDAKGVELGFHTDQIYAREGNGANLFEVAETVTFDTTSMTTYELAIQNSTYTLYADGVQILTGAVRDYSDFEPPLPPIPDPYEEANFIFFGDNTTSASGIVRLWYISTTEGSVTPATPTSIPSGTNTPTATPTNTPMATETPDPFANATPAAKINLPLIIREP